MNIDECLKIILFILHNKFGKKSFTLNEFRDILNNISFILTKIGSILYLRDILRVRKFIKIYTIPISVKASGEYLTYIKITRKGILYIKNINNKEIVKLLLHP